MVIRGLTNHLRFSHDHLVVCMVKKPYIKVKLHKALFSVILSIIITGTCACGSSNEETVSPTATALPSASTESTQTPASSNAPAKNASVLPPSGEKGSRDNTPVCLVPVASGTNVLENEFAKVDASNLSDGYIIVKYTGSSDKVKLQITGPSGITYTYNLSTTQQVEEVFPLQSGNGEYMVNVFENIEGTQYSLVFTEPIQVNITDEFSPFLYPNQYVDFTSASIAVEQAKNLAYICNSDLDVVSEIYNFMITNITYDHEEAETVQSGYIPDVDEVLSTRKGICLDYAALMTTMLRCQRIPTRMEIGYAGTAYHAWLSTYITDVGWVNGIIEFDGKNWKLMDPTFASNVKEETLKDFIGDGSNYSVKYIY